MRADHGLWPGRDEHEGERPRLASASKVATAAGAAVEGKAVQAPRPGSLPPRVLKRALDVLLASILFLISAPVLLFACLAIWLETPGKPVFRQWRSGLRGRPFRIVKLRTMVNGADRLGPELTQVADPRITRIGSVLRRWSIDELPQLLNVVAGHMSMVGPRPELVTIVAGYTARQRQVLQVRPGLTGWAQIQGRDELPIPVKLDLELDYVASRSALQDMMILVRTVWVVLSGQGVTR